MNAFFVRIRPTRTDFESATTAAEDEVMEKHFIYWRERMEEGALILAGPVLVENDAFGVLVVRAANDREAEALVRQDPAVSGNVMSYEVFPLRLSLYEGNQR